jgi:hypothetical protein
MDKKEKTIEVKNLDEVKKIIEDLSDGTVLSFDIQEVTSHAEAERK